MEGLKMRLTRAIEKQIDKWEGKDLIKAAHAIRKQFNLTHHQTYEVFELWMDTPKKKGRD